MVAIHPYIGSIVAIAVAHSAAEPLPGVLHGWNTTIGSAEDRASAANYFNVSVVDDESLWRNNSMTPFIGSTMHMTGIEIIERNAFNTIIETAVTHGFVKWTINKGPVDGVLGPFTEHINGGYTGVANTAGFASPRRWVENDNKHFLGIDIANDWGLIDVLSTNETTIVMNYSSYKKGRFIMIWTLWDNNSARYGPPGSCLPDEAELWMETSQGVCAASCNSCGDCPSLSGFTPKCGLVLPLSKRHNRCYIGCSSDQDCPSTGQTCADVTSEGGVCVYESEVMNMFA